MSDIKVKSTDLAKITGPDNGKDFVWPYSRPHPRDIKKIQDGELTIPDIKQVRMKMTSGYPIRVAVNNVTKEGDSKGETINLYTFRDEEQFKDWIESPVFDPKGYFTINGSNKVLAYEEWALSKAFVNVGTHPTKLFPGDKLFQLKATHGIPLEISLENLTRASMVVEWELFIKEARTSGWYDFQTLEVIQNALEDVFDRDTQEAVILRIKRFIMSHPINRINVEELNEILEKANITFPEFRASCRAGEDGKWDRDEVDEVIRIIKKTPVVKLP